MTMDARMQPPQFRGNEDSEGTPPPRPRVRRRSPAEASEIEDALRTAALAETENIAPSPFAGGTIIGGGIIPGSRQSQPEDDPAFVEDALHRVLEEGSPEVAETDETLGIEASATDEVWASEGLGIEVEPSPVQDEPVDLDPDIPSELMETDSRTRIRRVPVVGEISASGISLDRPERGMRREPSYIVRNRQLREQAQGHIALAIKELEAVEFDTLEKTLIAEFLIPQLARLSDIAQIRTESIDALRDARNEVETARGILERTADAFRIAGLPILYSTLGAVVRDLATVIQQWPGS